jgi:hypothetical protein
MTKTISCLFAAFALVTGISSVDFEGDKCGDLPAKPGTSYASKQSHPLAELIQSKPTLSKTAWPGKSEKIPHENCPEHKMDWLRARQPISKVELPVLPKNKNKHLLTVKFRDDLYARAVNGSVAFGFGTSNFFPDSVEGELQRMGVQFEQLIQLPEETLIFLELRGAVLSGVEQPDLAGLLRVDAPDHLINQLAISLFLHDEVEWVDFMELNPPPPICDGDIPPVTPNYTNQQGYRGPNPGLNMIAFWAMGSARGAGIRVADCEYGCNLTHEDLCDIIPEPNQTPVPQVYANGWHEHGTAVFGEILGGDNAYGVTGLSPDVQGYIFPEWTVEGGSRRTTCIVNAIASMHPGDVVLLEMQTTFPGTSGFGPAETSLPVWTAVKNGVDGGVVVVAAAGNGNQNLDAPEFASYRARGDSGAIIVGAGTPDVVHSKLSFSTYGNRVNVQGWGLSVFSTGYGSFAIIGNDPNQSYTSGFSGTSSASPFIASASASLQSYAVADIGRRLSPQELRQVFLNTGWPQQGSGGNIGRFPNLVQAANYITNEWGPPISVAVNLFIDMAGLEQGNLESLRVPDDNRICLKSIAPDRNPIREADSLAVQFTVRIPVPNRAPSRWGIRLEGHSDIEKIIQRVELYNYNNDSYQQVDNRLSAAGADGVSRIEIRDDINKFIQPSTTQIRARVTYSERPEVTATNWRVYVDHFVGFFED